jgi:hypothetical protein
LPLFLSLADYLKFSKFFGVGLWLDEAYYCYN